MTGVLGFNVTNGVRKGNVLSPVFFNIHVYMDDLRKELNTLKAGCIVNGVIANHLIYANDMVLMVLSPCALRELLHICERYGKLNVIKYNPKRTLCIMVLPKLLKSIAIPKFVSNNVELKTVEKQKYLSVFVTEGLTDDVDMERQRNYR